MLLTPHIQITKPHCMTTPGKNRDLLPFFFSNLKIIHYQIYSPTSSQQGNYQEPRRILYVPILLTMSKNHHTTFRRLTTTTLSFIRNNSRSNTPTLYFCPFSLSPQPWGSISHHRSRWRFRHTSNFHPLQSSNLQNTWQQHLRSMPMRFFLPFQSQLSLLMGFLFFSDCGGFAFFNFFSFQFVLLIPSLKLVHIASSH